MHSAVVRVATTLLAGSVAANAQAFTAGQLIKTTSGGVVGQASAWRPSVSEYLGVPFAEPPVGALRWAPPQPFRGADKTIKATKYVSKHLFVESWDLTDSFR
jgi:hypothetical protein